MSPEQASGLPVDARSDIFSFGIVLYELLAGRHPFEGTSAITVMHEIASKRPPAMPQHTPASVRHIIEKTLEKSPAHRYQTMRDLAADLRRVVEQQSDRVISDRASSRTAWDRRSVVVAALVSVVSLGALAVAAGRWTWGAAAPAIRSVAVLPLKPLFQASDDGQLGIGLADTIIGRLGQLEGVVVRPTSAVRRYSALDANSLQAGADLAVDAVLEGSLQRSGDRLRVNASLIRVEDGRTLWNQTFDTTFADIFAVEDEIAHRVVAQLRPRLNDVDRARLARHQTASPEAYEYLLKGVATFSAVGAAAPNVVGNVQAGVELLERAVALDPGYALAHAQLGWGYAWLATIEGKEDAAIRSRAALARADELDPRLAQTHVARGLLLGGPNGGYQLLPAFESLRKAQMINPNVGHYDVGALLAETGLLEPALRALRRAIEIDPTNESARAEIPNAYW